MTDVLSRMSSQYRIVVPRPVRERLLLVPGDVVRFQVTAGGPVILERECTTGEGAFAAFDEWSSDEDDRLYRDL